MGNQKDFVQVDKEDKTENVAKKWLSEFVEKAHTFSTNKANSNSINDELDKR